MIAEFDYGAEVRLTRTVHNDGSFPGKKRGDLLVRKGSIGFVRDVGVFLQDQLIYQVHFLDCGYTVGCREQELVAADLPWIDSEFEFGDWVEAATGLAIQGQVIAEVGARGQVMAVRRELTPIRYEVLFADRLLQVPASAIRWPANAVSSRDAAVCSPAIAVGSPDSAEVPA